MNFIISILKKSLNKISGNAYIPILDRINYLIRKYKVGYFSGTFLDRKLEKYLNFDNGFFVELGANDGITQSNSLYFELKRNWRGVLVEPSPNNFIKCFAQRSNRNSFFCNACVSFEYKEKYVEMRYANLMSISSDLSLELNDKEIHINESEICNNDKVSFSFGAKSATLNSLLEKANAPKLIDFLSLDVEGAELEVLKGIDFKKFNFKYLLIEVRNIKGTIEYLEKYNYFLEERFTSNDYLFKLLEI